MPVAVLGLVDFTSRAVNFGFELDTGSEQREREGGGDAESLRHRLT